jgi:hypothetical protein
VVAALWRSVETQAVEARATATGQSIHPTDPAWITEIARQVADAVTTQAPSTTIDHRDHYTGHGASLTASLALAFLDQTLQSAPPQRKPFTTSLRATHTKSFDGLASLRSHPPRDKALPSVWANVLSDFVDDVNTIAAHTGIPVWTHLRDHLQTPPPVLPDPGHQSAPPHPADGDTPPAGPSRGIRRARQLTTPDRRSTRPRLTQPDPHDDLTDRPTVVDLPDDPAVSSDPSSAETSPAATTVTPTAATREELKKAWRIISARIRQSNTRLPSKDAKRARQNLKERSANEGLVAWPAWRERPELRGLFPSVLALSALRWPNAKKADSAELAGLRLQLGQTVVAALWRSVETQAVEARATATGQSSHPTDPAWMPEIARQVAAAVTTQAPSTTIDHRHHYTGHGASLTASLALAFLDQTLQSAPLPTEPFTTSLQSAHTRTFDRLASLRPPRNADRRLPSVWADELNAFVDDVNTIAAHTGIPVWTHLRDHLQTPRPVLPDPRHQSAPPHPADDGTPPAGPSRGIRRARQLTTPDRRSTAATTVTPAATTREELIEARRILGQRIGQSSTKLRPQDLSRARQNLTRWSANEGFVAWPAWRRDRPELKGLFSSVLALSCLQWPGRGKDPDSAELVGFRLQLGQTVVAALWHSVETQAVEARAAATGQSIDPTDPAWITNIARQVADAVTTQAPTATINHRNHYTGQGATLTSGLALAFLDQTLQAAPPQREPFTTSLRSAHTKTLRHLTSLQPDRRAYRTLPSVWAKVLNAFVDAVNNAAAPTGIPVWTHLRDHLQTPLPGLPGGDPAPADSPRDHPDDWTPPDDASPHPDDIWNDLDDLMDLPAGPYPGETSQAGHHLAGGAMAGYWYEQMWVHGTGSPQEDSPGESPQAPGRF